MTEFNPERFKKLSGEEISLLSYVTDFIKTHPETRIVVGCDSQEKFDAGESLIKYAVVVALFYPGNKGAHLLFSRLRRRQLGKFRPDLFSRLWLEIELAKETAEFISEKILGESPADRFASGSKVEIHIDINEDQHHKSNILLSSAIGYLESAGFITLAKPYGFVASCASDNFCR